MARDPAPDVDPDPTATSLVFDTVEHADPAALARVDDGLDAHNRAEPALRDVRPLAVLARDAAGQVAGGAVGRTWGECCELQQLWVAPARRRHGVARTLMARFEHAAAARGCTLVYLDTFSFQAPGFYARLGYREVLRTAGYTGGHVRSTMHKSIAPGDDFAADGDARGA